MECSKSQYNGRGKHKQNVHKAEHQRISEQPPEVGIGEKEPEVIQGVRFALKVARPGAAENPLRRLIILESGD